MAQTQDHGVWEGDAQGLTSLDKCAHTRFPCNRSSALGFPSALGERDTHTYHHHHYLTPVSPTSALRSCLQSVRFSHFFLSTPRPSFNSGYHHLLSTKSLADFPDSGLVWMFCATGSRKPRLGCLAVRKQWAESTEGQAWALWVTLGGSRGSSALLCLCPPSLPPPPVYLLEGL